MLNSFTFQATPFYAGLLLSLALLLRSTFALLPATLLRSTFALRPVLLLRASAH